MNALAHVIVRDSVLPQPGSGARVVEGGRVDHNVVSLRRQHGRGENDGLKHCSRHAHRGELRGSGPRLMTTWLPKRDAGETRGGGQRKRQGDKAGRNASLFQTVTEGRGLQRWTDHTCRFKSLQ